MKIFIILFVLMLGLAATGANAQEPSPTPVMTSLAVFNLLPPATVRLGSGQDIQYGFFIGQDSYTIPANDVVLTAKLPAGVSFVSATSTHGICTHSDGVVTCNLGTLIRYYPDYTAIVRIYLRPTVAGAVTITGNIKGSNTLNSAFTQTRMVNPAKSRIRARFF